MNVELDMPSPEASRRNLARYWNRVGRPRSGDESALCWRLTLRWYMSDPRSPGTQQEWAEQLGVSQPYVAKMVRRFKREWFELAGKWTGWQEATLDDLRRAREVGQRARARLAEDLEWERYDAEQRRKQHAAESREMYGAKQQPTSDDECCDEDWAANAGRRGGWFRW